MSTGPLREGSLLQDAISQAQLESWLRQKIAARIPAAIVRLSDGEARLLTCERDEAEVIGEIVRQLEMEAGISFSIDAIFKIKALVMLAYERADVLGILGNDRSLEARRMWLDRLAADHGKRLAAGRPRVLLTECMLNHRITDNLPDLLAGRRVSVISPRDLKPLLEGDWGLEDVVLYQVPSQYDARDVDGAYEAAMHDLPVWPDAHARLHSEVAVRERGEIFLVGAGFFGKDLCIRVRDQGGIALDMGSALDELAGKVTRGPKRRVLNRYASGMSMDEIVDYIKRFYGVPVEAERLSEGIRAMVRGEIDDWLTRRLDAVYSILRFDALEVPIRQDRSVGSHVCHVAVGVNLRGYREPLAIWWQFEGSREFWSTALADLHARGVRDFSVVCRADAREPLTEAARTVFPQARVEVRVDSDPLESTGTVRDAVEAHGAFPDEPAAMVLIYLAMKRAEAALGRGVIEIG